MSHLARGHRFMGRIGAVSRQFSSVPPWEWDGSSAVHTKAWMPNGAMKRGPKYFIDYWVSGNGVNAWVLMPGVPKENVTVKVTGSHIVYKGTEALHLPDFRLSQDSMLRHFEGTFDIDPSRFDAANLKAEIVDGIFWLHIPKSTH